MILVVFPYFKDHTTPSMTNEFYETVIAVRGGQVLIRIYIGFKKDLKSLESGLNTIFHSL